MANEIKIDYEDLFTGLKWDLDKASFLIADVQKFFDCPDREYPDREHVEAIRGEYKHIAVMLGLLNDLVERMTDTVAPLS